MTEGSSCLPWALALLLASASCAPAGEVDGPAPAEVRSCGVRAAMDHRQPEALRESPPACALPTAEEVASSCAIQDLVTKPGYRGPSYDEEGNPKGDGEPVPDYRAEALSCHFTDPLRNKALCRFALSFPQSPGAPVPTVATFEHRFWQDHGPAHHWYGTRWSAMDRCTPAPR
ncbi:MAG TPA: hypothetical protein VGB04_05360 [Allosphingosinicella sp.]|jgi:hypothetical protein